MKPKLPGRRRTAASATADLDDDTYERPPKHVCQVLDSPVPLDDEGLNRFFWCQWIYRGKVVHFSVEQQTRADHDSPWLKVRRIDSSNGTVHEHWFTRADQDAGHRNEVKIPRQGWDFVDAQFPVAMGVCNDEAEEHLERWSR